MSSSENIFLKPAPFKNGHYSAGRDIHTQTQFCREVVGQVDKGHMKINSCTFEISSLESNFFTGSVSLQCFPSSNWKSFLYNKLRVPCLNLIIWRLKWELLDLSILWQIRLKLECTLNNKKTWFFILVFELHSVHDI